MNNFEWGLVKARKKMQQKHDHAIIEKMKRGTIIAAIGISAALSLGAADGHDYRIVEETYTVQQGDTLWTIGQAFIAKNTYGRRYLPEFIEGIKQLNEELVESHGQVEPGQKLRVTYWVNSDE